MILSLQNIQGTETKGNLGGDVVVVLIQDL